MKNTLETRLGIFFALALVVAVILLEMVGGADLFKRGRALRARFDTVGELKVGDPVKVAGKQVGRVKAVEFADQKIEVTLMILDPKAVIRTDSKATVRFSGLMGQNYVAIDFGSPQGLPVTADALLETYEQPDLNAIMTRLDHVAGGIENVTKTLSGDSLNSLVAPFTDFMKENSPRLTGILSNAHKVSQQIVEGQGTIGKLLHDDQLYASALATVTNLNTTATDLQTTIADARHILASVNEGKGTVGLLVKDEQLYRETTAAMTNLNGILQRINQGQGTVGKLVNDEALYKNAKMTLQKLDKATEGLEDQGPLSVIGMAINNLF